MVHDCVHIPLGKEFKTGSVGKDHPQHGMCLFQPAFLVAPHVDHNNKCWNAEFHLHRFPAHPDHRIPNPGRSGYIQTWK